MTSGSDVTIDVLSQLDPETIQAVSELIEHVTEHDGLRPVSEHVWLHLKEGGDPRGQHLVARAPDGSLIGYAHLDVTDAVEGPSAEVVVAPHLRRRGVGRSIVEVLIRRSPDGRLRLWAHGEQAGATELATGMGFTLARVLWQMRRSLYAPLPRTEIPPGFDVRPFRVGVDEDAWLAVNARAFVHLPDQGGWTRDDLERRLHEPWFAAEGFLMAWAGDQLAGFHWTKVHGRVGQDNQHHHQPMGEVYVVAVDPAYRGTGLGRGLTLAGLHHLRSLDLSQAMLYVDATNTQAIALYEGLGFARWDTDVLFRRSP